MDVLNHGEESENKNVSYLRRMKKPMIEKKRRDRINKSLSCLKVILLDNIRKNGGTQTSKLDKADILEMTVNYLRMLQYGHSTMISAYSSQYNTGYTDCVREAMRYLKEARCYGNDVTSRLGNHLSHTQPILETITRNSHSDETSHMGNKSAPLTVRIPNWDNQQAPGSYVYIYSNELDKTGNKSDICVRSLVSSSSGYVSQSATDCSDTSSVCSPCSSQGMENNKRKCMDSSPCQSMDNLSDSDRPDSPDDVWRPW